MPCPEKTLQHFLTFPPGQWCCACVPPFFRWGFRQHLPSLLLLQHGCYLLFGRDSPEVLPKYAIPTLPLEIQLRNHDSSHKWRTNQDVNKLLSSHYEKSQALREGLEQNKVLRPITNTILIYYYTLIVYLLI